MEGGFEGVNLDPENMGISYGTNVGNLSNEIKNELLHTNDNRRHSVVPRNFTESNLPRTKMLQKVVAFGFV